MRILKYSSVATFSSLPVAAEKAAAIHAKYGVGAEALLLSNKEYRISVSLAASPLVFDMLTEHTLFYILNSIFILDAKSSAVDVCPICGKYVVEGNMCCTDCRRTILGGR